jgi:DNA helicase-2/ATP-dependent DNA helicase PcrA
MAAAPSPSGSSLKLSPQQQAVVDFGAMDSGNFLVEAVAGAGKTTTLAQMCTRLRGSTVVLVFNKKNVGEFEKKLAQLGAGGVRVSTFHAAGMQAWRSAYPRVRVDDKKLDRLMWDLQVPKELRGFVAKLTGLVKQACVDIAWRQDDRWKWLDLIDHFDLEDLLRSEEYALDSSKKIDSGIDWTRQLLAASIAANEQAIDFDDMLHAPLLEGVRFTQYTNVLLDEAQDTNFARMLMAERMLAPGGRLCAVGDRHQAIYGFTGAESDALDQIAEHFNCTRLPLTVSYRCPRVVVEHARKWVSHISAAPEAPEGIVRELPEREFLKLTPDAADAVLCRNTKPLVELAFQYIRRHIPCHVEGREIGQGLIALARRWKDVWRAEELVDHLEDFLKEERAKLLRRGREEKAEALSDRVETLLVLIESLKPGATVQDLEQVIRDLFQDSEVEEATVGGLFKPKKTLTLSTVHKAKGREWSRVFILGRNRYMPSKYAKQDWQLEQEKNLIYVAVTRAMNELVEVVVPKPGDISYEIAPAGLEPGFHEVKVTSADPSLSGDAVHMRIEVPKPGEVEQPEQITGRVKLCRHCGKFASWDGEVCEGCIAAPFAAPRPEPYTGPLPKEDHLEFHRDRGAAVTKTGQLAVVDYRPLVERPPVAFPDPDARSVDWEIKTVEETRVVKGLNPLLVKALMQKEGIDLREAVRRVAMAMEQAGVEDAIILDYVAEQEELRRNGFSDLDPNS